VISPLLPRAADLERWATEYTSSAMLPRLVRRLIAATTRFTRLDFPADRAVWYSGWDGIAVVTTDCAWVPDGMSGWELGTEPNVRRKAMGDYKNRCDDPVGLVQGETAFVLVTPHAWAPKAKVSWATQRRAEQIWRDVRVVDGHDLETWLESAPTVHLWLAEVMGRDIQDIRTLENWWLEWSRATRPPIGAPFLTAGRADAANTVGGWVSGPPATHALRAASRDEALALIAAALVGSGEDEYTISDALGNSLIVGDAPAWRRLVPLGQRLVLLPTYEEPDAVGAVEAGHVVVQVLGPGEPFTGDVLELPQLDRDHAAAVLVAAGTTEEQARDDAALARKSLPAYRRRRAINQRLRVPAWASPEPRSVLIAPLLTTSWDRASAGDREILTSLGDGRSYAALEASLEGMAADSDPPVSRIGDTWVLTDKLDLWTQTARWIPSARWATFEHVALDVLGAADPTFTLSPDEQFLAPVRGIARPHSERLRAGISDTIAMLGASADVETLTDGRPGSDLAASIVRRALNRANADSSGAAWAAIAENLPPLAEAAPDDFLIAVDDGVRGQGAPVLRLFPDVAEPIVWPRRSYFWGLLSALEMLGWEPSYLGRVAISLARMARLVPTDRGANRPLDSLVRLLLTWHSQTSASVDEQLGVIDELLLHEPDVAWALLGRLLPYRLQTTTDTRSPRYRTWRTGRTADPAPAQQVQLVNAIGTRLVSHAGSNVVRWSELIQNYERLPLDAKRACVAGLRLLDPATLAADDRETLAGQLRNEAARHRAHPNAPWAMTAEQTEELGELVSRFEPDDVIRRIRWLFDANPNAQAVAGADFLNYEVRLAEARAGALDSVLADRGPDGVDELMAMASSPSAVGWALGSHDGMSDQAGMAWAVAGDPQVAECGRTFFAARMLKNGPEWARDVLASQSVPPQVAGRLLASLPADRERWELATRLGPGAERAYWESSYGYPPAEVDQVGRMLLAYNRAPQAVDVLGMAVHRGQFLDVDLAVSALRACALTDHIGVDLAMLSYTVEQLLDQLERQGVEAEQLASLEWLFLDLLDLSTRGTKTLHDLLATRPAFFVEVLSLVYRADDEEPRELDEQDLARLDRARGLLHSWHQPPGVARNGTLDARALYTWVEESRTLARDAKRSAIANEHIGAVLRHVPMGSDGIWPHEALRDLIEQQANQDLEAGIRLEVTNSRGATMRGVTDDGSQERGLAARYKADAEQLNDRWHRTAQMLRDLATEDAQDARRWDVRAALIRETES